MELIERAGFLSVLRTKFNDVAGGEGHCILVSGEAGIGKTSLIRAFCREKKREATICLGICDALFTPRPLGPLHDIIWQISGDEGKIEGSPEDRVGLFTRFLHKLSDHEPALIVFEDIHWADEATLDFVKFLARRITRVPCLFILTYRDDEVNSPHPVRNLLGELPAHSFTRLQLAPLSREAVERLSGEKGYRGEDVYSITGGNPFYVNEILASYSPGIPENIRDSILSVYNRLPKNTRELWALLSVLPTGLELEQLEKLEPGYAEALAPCIEAKLLYLKDGKLFFKHELYRRTIETSLSPFKRIDLNKRVLEVCIDDLEKRQEIYRVIHHAKNANDYAAVVRYAPIAARQAAALGAHVEASRLYLSAIEYYQGRDKEVLVELYARYANECYLTNRIKEAIVYQGKVLNICKEKEDREGMGDSLWFLSRLWWFDGDRKQAELLARQAVDILADEPASRAKAMAFSNMSQLRMLSDQPIECMHWGEIAIGLARELNDEEILCHALNNVGTVQMRVPSYRQKGLDLLRQSLDLALRNGYQEHAARAYSNLFTNSVRIKDYALARQVLPEGLHYCEERELDSWKTYILSWKARLLMDTGVWNEALQLAGDILGREDQASIVRIDALVVKGTILMRRGDAEALPLLMEAKAKAYESMELQRILPSLTALLEYDWLVGGNEVSWWSIEVAISMIGQSASLIENSAFAFWLRKALNRELPSPSVYEAYDLTDPQKAAALWQELGCPYEQAVLLFEGDEDDKKKAIAITQQLGAEAIGEKMKQDLRLSGIKSIPRGLRKTTQQNPAQLTDREISVLALLKEGLQNKEIGSRLFISAKTVDHHISAILFKLNVNSRTKAVLEAVRLGIVKE